MLLELESANPFRVRAYQRAAQTVGGLPEPVSGLSAEQLLEVPGIGKGIAAHLAEINDKGTFRDLIELRRKVPKGLLELLKVQGLGPKRARVLFDTLKIDSLEKLRAEAGKGRLRALKGFGEKLEASILKGLDFVEAAGRRMLAWEARALAAGLVEALAAVKGVARVDLAGSLRRGRETVGDLDILACGRAGAAAVSAFTKLPQVERVLASGSTKASVLLRAGLPCDLRVVPAASFGAALQYFTGSKDHNVALRERASARGLTVNEYGVFRASDTGRKRPLAGKTEEEVYRKLGMDWIPPELRENRGELQAAAEKRLPRLVALADVKGDFHNHSTHTDGADTLEAMARAAAAMGWEWVALGDHSQSLGVANGLSVPRLRASFRELDGIRAKVRGIRLMRSMEVDILKDGSLDYPDDVLSEIDVVIGSVHSAFQLGEAEMTERILKAVRHPRLHIVGHLTGRLLNRRAGYAVDAEKVLAEAARTGTALELNGQPQRHDIDDVRARRARELGCPLAVTTDAHAAAHFGYMTSAVTIARRAWLTKDDLLNCLSAAELQRWLTG